MFMEEINGTLKLEYNRLNSRRLSVSIPIMSRGVKGSEYLIGFLNPLNAYF